MRAGLSSFVTLIEKADGEQRSAGGDHGKQKNEETAQIFLLRYAARMLRKGVIKIMSQSDKREYHQRRTRSSRQSAHLRSEDNAREARNTDAPAANPKTRRWRASGRRDKIDNAHLWRRVTNIRQPWQVAIAKVVEISGSHDPS